ncbi:hypothetical protein A9174_19460 [Mesorhizobium loti NZP2037]|nr:hypothetical protein [Mesorhizobium loti]ANN58708.1 hypothetical protein A9174_19460 [Mesorhizobium loti NZP2037]
MVIQRKADEAGVFDPSALALLDRVFEQLKLDDCCVFQNEALASRIIANYLAGVVDEAELALMSRPSAK